MVRDTSLLLTQIFCGTNICRSIVRLAKYFGFYCEMLTCFDRGSEENVSLSCVFLLLIAVFVDVKRRLLSKFFLLIFDVWMRYRSPLKFYRPLLQYYRVTRH